MDEKFEEQNKLPELKLGKNPHTKKKNNNNLGLFNNFFFCNSFSVSWFHVFWYFLLVDDVCDKVL